ncbi:MAG: acetylglutamate kinase [Candidatus Abyssobacteria bacterium SURF_17]|uniref:Acetylglutamate kinase n=1 Tax=Candidatus Abyssobacteria bacterium SURF_17 TaxID=2093361 RepID=A0A419EVW5_9BACT|nr:MAG: acetylglutamate kinase [Candidatus Abyssubacteria bacterium SURF_17]
MREYIEKAKVLIEALPYFRKFYGKTVVIKYGGSAMEDAEIRQTTAADIVLMKYVGMNPVVIHGGGKAISEIMEKMGKKPVFHKGMRVTDDETKDIVEMVLVGRLNKEVVTLINQAGGKAVGVSGKDGNLIRSSKYYPKGSPGVDMGFVGDVKEINPDLIRSLEQSGYIAVVAPIGVGENGETHNINADSVAGALAAALKAEKLVLLTDTPGILRAKGDEASLISTLRLSEVEQLVASGVIEGGMIPKVEACESALKAGVSKTHIIDGRIIHALLLEIFTDKGIGTQIIP